MSALAALHIGEIDIDDLMNSKGYHHPWYPPWATYRRYANSKLANILFSRELGERLKGSGVTTYSLHPGNLIDRTLLSVRRLVGLVLNKTTFSFC